MRIDLKGINRKEYTGDKICLLLKKNQGFAFKPKTIIEILRVDENTVRAAIRRLYKKEKINRFNSGKVNFYFI